MNPFDVLETQIEQLRNQTSASLTDRRNLLLEIEEFINSEDYQALSPDERNRLQTARKDLITQVQEQSGNSDQSVTNPEEEPSARAGISSRGQSGSSPSNRDNDNSREAAREHNPVAEQQMDVAEKLFYSGRYAEAIQLFDRVLQLEPNWERVRQHRSEAESYLRTGYIPAVALPADAASAYGKAQSAAKSRAVC